jgi:hypothetical protein
MRARLVCLEDGITSCVAHLRVMDFSITPGKAGYYAWKVGLVGLWQKRLHAPARATGSDEEAAGGQGGGAGDLAGRDAQRVGVGWQLEHQYVVRPATVARARLLPHRGHAPSGPRTATKLPV